MSYLFHYFESRHGLTNGESVVMYQTPKGENVKFQYTFLNDDCMYETTRYNMNKNGSFVDYSKCKNNFGSYSDNKFYFLSI